MRACEHRAALICTGGGNAAYTQELSPSDSAEYLNCGAPGYDTVKLYMFTSIYQPTNAHIISHKTHLKHFKTLRHVSILSDHHQGA